MIDIWLPEGLVEDYDFNEDMDLALKKLQYPHANGKRKRSNRSCEIITNAKVSIRKNFEFFAFRDPVLFIGHLSKVSVLIVDMPWMEVIKKMESTPVHRHIFGT